MATNHGTWLRCVLLACGLAACSPDRGSGTTALRSSPTPMAFDSGRGVLVLLRGLGGGREGETLEWDGMSWSLRATTGPSPREGHALAYDSARAVTVLFGGFQGSGVKSNETWEWDGKAWTLRTPSRSPSARYGHAMAFDSGRGRIVLHGGFVNGLDAETWEWDGTNWRLRGFGPSQRSRHAMAYDVARGVTVLFGGQGDGVVGETWEWSGSAWTQRSPALEPSPRFLHAMAYDEARATTVLFGGFDGAMNGETWEWDGTDWTQHASSEPGPRAAHSMAYDGARGLTVLHGGSGHEDETWEWDGAHWAPPSPPPMPSPFARLSMLEIESPDSGAGSVPILRRLDLRQEAGVRSFTWSSMPLTTARELAPR